MSLKQKLYEELQIKGYITLDEVHAIAHREGKKESNAERTLRPSNSGTYVETKYDNKGQVKGYKWLGGFSMNESVYTEEEVKRRKHEYHHQKLEI